VISPSPKKSESRVQRGYFMGFTKSRLLIRWLDPSTNEVKHANAARFDEHNVHISSSDQLSPGSLLLHNDTISSLPNPAVEINLSDTPHIQSDIFSLTFTLPPLGKYPGCSISTCTYHYLPYISSITKGSQLAQLFSTHGQHNSTYWILSLNNKEFSHAPSIINYLSSLKQPNTPTPVLGYFAKRQSSTTRTTIDENRAMFSQIRLLTMSNKISSSSNLSLPLPVPIGKTVIVSPTRPCAPNHIGELTNNLFYSDWKCSLFQNYDKMLAAGT
jgi:hypothetical protein